jgi:hypothetical protein
MPVRIVGLDAAVGQVCQARDRVGARVVPFGRYHYQERPVTHVGGHGDGSGEADVGEAFNRLNSVMNGMSNAPSSGYG